MTMNMAVPMSRYAGTLISAVPTALSDSVKTSSGDSISRNTVTPEQAAQLNLRQNEAVQATNQLDNAAKQAVEAKTQVFNDAGQVTDPMINDVAENSQDRLGDTSQDLRDDNLNLKRSYSNILDHLQNTSDKAHVDPERYATKLGVNGRTMAAIGMIISGMGSGLTGQENMAMKMYQKNIDRDIDAQKEEFKQAAETLAQARGIHLTDVQKKQNDALANNLAQQGAIQATSALWNQAANKSYGLGMNQQYKEMMAKQQMELARLQQDFARMTSGTINSNSVVDKNGLGLLLDGAYTTLTGDKSRIGSRYTPTQRFSLGLPADDNETGSKLHRLLFGEDDKPVSTERSIFDDIPDEERAANRSKFHEGLKKGFSKLTDPSWLGNSNSLSNLPTDPNSLINHFSKKKGEK